MKIATRALAGLCLSAVVAGASAAAQTGPEKPKRTQEQGSRGGSEQQERRAPWWRDAAVQKELDLSTRQVAKIEKIFGTNFPGLRELHKQMRALETETNRLIRENTADEKVLAVKLDQLEHVRSRINKERTLMVYRMHQTLTPEQYRKLTDINERRGKERGRR